MNMSLTLDRRRTSRGVALVITLAFVVLLTGLVVAFFTRAVTSRQISDSSAAQTKAELFARGALDSIVADITQEIIDGSDPKFLEPISNPLQGLKIYVPKTAQNAIPERVPAVTGPPDPATVNMVKRSVRNQSFYTGSNIVRAAAASSLTPSINGHFISSARWSKPMLTDSDIPSPDWVVVSRDGTNATAYSKALSNQGDVNKYVVGRYAYVIYDEGGLLDLNAAGYPSAMSKSQSAYKDALAFADLTQIPGLTSSQIDSLVGWRNYASAAIDRTESPPKAGKSLTGAFPSFKWAPENATNYLSFVRGNRSGFLKADNPLVIDDRWSDQMFVSRQQMIDLFIGGLGTTSQPLQYFTHFSRDINQPSISPNPNRPPLLTEANGGNDKIQSEYDNHNPSFLRVRAPANYTTKPEDAGGVRASDGRPPAFGVEPHVKYRFPLNRIAWLTPRGPIAKDDGSALNPTNDPDVKKIIDKLKDAGFSEEFLKRGTRDNIRRNFGFLWEGSKTGRWKYRRSETSPGPLQKLYDQATAGGREPDFVELVKAAVSMGALGKSSGKRDATGNDLHPIDYQHEIDVDSERQIMQIVANMIDQFDYDGYPTRIAFATGTEAEPNAMSVCGVENHPYFYRVRTGTLIARNPTPLHARAGSKPTISAEEFDSGVGLILHVPELWNPHDGNASMGDPRPNKFRVVVDSTDPKSIPDPLNPANPNSPSTDDLSNYNAMAAVGRNSSYKSSSYSNDTDVNKDFKFSSGPKGTGTLYGYDPGLLRRAIWSGTASSDAALSTIFTFDVNAPSTGTSTLFREPTMLAKVGFPMGSNFKGPDYSGDVYLGSSVLKKSSGAAVFQSGGFVGDGVNPLFPLVTSATQPITGVVVGLFPLRWITGKDAKAEIFGGNWPQIDVQGADKDSRGTPHAFLTYRVQYQDSKVTGNPWVTYDEKYTEVTYNRLAAAVTERNEAPYGGLNQSLDTVSIPSINPSDNNNRDPGFTWQVWVDPRTSRFGGITFSHFIDSKNYYAPGARIEDWLDGTDMVLKSNRPDVDKGFPIPPRGRYSSDPGGANAAYPRDFYSSYRNKGFEMDAGNFWPGLLSQNTVAGGSRFSDADGVVRRASGAFAGTSKVGLPMAKDNMQSRPYILNRPFRSVAELGYVFTGAPWKNINFSTPESGFSGLLDLFCVNDMSANQDPMVAGRVNLNTQQAPVLQAILSGAYKDDLKANSSVIDTTVAQKIASDAAAGFINKTRANPLGNLSELVGRLTNPSALPDGSKMYEGPLKDLGTVFGANTPESNIQRFRESAIRALSNVGSTRVWNLMIDLIAQTGRYPSTADHLDKFAVEGEQRYWLHVAIDRYSGKVIDHSIEVVKE